MCARPAQRPPPYQTDTRQYQASTVLLPRRGDPLSPQVHPRRWRTMAAGRAAVSSGNYTVRLSKGSGNIEVGYLVGCQINIDGLEGGLSGALDALGGTAGLSGSVSVPLTPGQVAYVKVIDRDITNRVASIQTSRFEIDVQKCGGYASARSVVKVVAAEGYNTDGGTVNGTGGYVQSTLYGKPFSLN